MTKTIGYWVSTALVAAAMGMGGVMDLLQPPELMESMAHLGYPAYFVTILGAWKLASVPALLLPRFALVKEWAYAGIAFDLSGAAASHAFAGDPAGMWLTPLVLLGLAGASWWLRPATRKVPRTEAELASAT